MRTNIRQINGNWDLGYALDKHTISSIPTGVDEYGHTTFDTTRTEVGEALYQLKYKHDWQQVIPLATTMARNIYPMFQNVGLIIPMAPSKRRPRQPVTEIAQALGQIVQKPCFENILIKTPNGKSLKDLSTKVEKTEALEGTLSFADEIKNEGRWNALLVDDLYHTGASIEAACRILRSYPKIEKIYVATLTWR